MLGEFIMTRIIFVVLLIYSCSIANAQTSKVADRALIESIQKLDSKRFGELVESKDIVVKPTKPAIDPSVARRMPVNPSRPLGCGQCTYGGNLQLWVTEEGRTKILNYK